MYIRNFNRNAKLHRDEMAHYFKEKSHDPKIKRAIKVLGQLWYEAQLATTAQTDWVDGWVHAEWDAFDNTIRCSIDLEAGYLSSCHEACREGEGVKRTKPKGRYKDG